MLEIFLMLNKNVDSWAKCVCVCTGVEGGHHGPGQVDRKQYSPVLLTQHYHMGQAVQGLAYTQAAVLINRTARHIWQERWEARLTLDC